MARSISFDHAADTYDETRALPAHIAPKLTDALLREIDAARAGLLLEIGVGTGRISRPLAGRGRRVFGVDIAPRMLARLREQLGPAHLPPDLALADALRLPVADGAVRALLMVHVLHLILDWRDALREVRRVLAPGGVFLHDQTRYPGKNPWAPGFAKWRELLAARGFTMRRRPDDDDLHRALRALGGSLRTEVYATDEERTAPAFWLDQTRRRVNSWTWEIPDDLFEACLPEYERWALHHYGNLEREYLQQVSYELEVWSFS